MKYLHADFLESSRPYEQARSFWRSLLEEAQMRHDVRWQIPWLNELPAELQDGNPIFTAWSPLLRRGLRVIQRRPSVELPDLGYWLDVFGGGLHEPGAVEELVLNCSPSVELVPQLQALMSSWISGARVSVSFDVPQLITEGRQLVLPVLSHHVDVGAAV